MTFAEGLRTTIAVGEECVINIDATEAGIGQISCSIAGDGGEVIIHRSLHQNLTINQLICLYLLIH